MSTPAAGGDDSKKTEAMETEDGEGTKNIEGKENGNEETAADQEGKEVAAKEPKEPKKMGVHRGRFHKISPKAAERQELEEQKLAIMMIPRKKKRMFHILRRKEKKRDACARRLAQKRVAIDHEKEKTRKAQKARKAAAQQ